MPLREAASVLGCTQPCLRQLAKLGHLQMFERTRLHSQFARGVSVIRDEVFKLKGRAASIECRPSTSYTVSLVVHAKNQKIAVSVLIDRVLRGEVVPALRLDPEKGFSSWRFEATRPKGWRTIRDLNGGVPVAEASAACGFDAETFSALLAQGVIKSIVVRGKLRSIPHPSAGFTRSMSTQNHIKPTLAAATGASRRPFRSWAWNGNSRM